MKILIKMKKYFYTLSLLVCMLGVSQFTWAWDSYYAKLIATTPNSTSQGKVYAGSYESPSESARISEHSSSETEVKATTIKAWAYPQNERYAFYKWEFVASSGNSKTKNTNITSSDIDSKKTDNPISLDLWCPLGSKNNADKASVTEIRAIFYRPGGVSIDQLTFLPTTNGQYSVAGTKTDESSYSYSNIRSSQQTVNNVTAGIPIECWATPDEGYIFYSYYSLDSYGNKAYIGDLLEPHQILLIEDDVVKIGAEFTNNAFRIGETFVLTLADALQAVSQSSVKTIQVVRSHTVEPGYYTIPADVNLLVPLDVDQTDTIGHNLEEKGYVSSAGSTPTGAYKTLTLGDGVNIECFGTIEVGCYMDCAGQGAPGVGRPGGRTYGQIIMNAGSSITMNSGAKLYGWGFITGEGEIDVRRGATIREMFQLLDWKGGTASSGMIDNDNKVFKVFPLTQYFIQNVEVPTTYHPGSRLIGSSAVFVGGNVAYLQEVGIIGVGGRDNAMFLMKDTLDSEDTWVRKYYNVATDMQCYEINNSARLGSLVFHLYVDFDSRDFILPITNNMKIHLLNGEMLISQNTELLPGAEIEVDKKAKVIVDEGQTLYLYDSLQWANAYVYNGQFASRVKYRPGGQPNVRTLTAAGIGDAKLNIHGTFDIQGALYTTEGGARIFSNNEDAGTIMFSKAAPSENVSIYQFNGLKDGYATYTNQIANPAILRNGDGTYPTTSTAGTDSLQSYCYVNNRWVKFTVDQDSDCFVYDQYDTYYAKPGAYVAINATKDPITKKISGNDDHTYSDAAGKGRLFILTEGCQWWEVENIDNLYRCIYNKDTTFYYWDEDYEEWAEKRFEIKWMNWDGTPVMNGSEAIEYMMPYGSMPKFLSSSPQREADLDFVYNFTGWSPALSRVTGDQTYTATYSKDTIKYEITFKYQEGIKQGSIISRQFLPRDSMPIVPTLYPIAGYESYSWSPSVGVVTGNQTYEARWVETAPTTFNIRFNNYDGSVLKKLDKTTDAVYVVEADASPVYDGATPAKAATNEYTYTFTGWKGPKGFTPKENALPGADADATYTAQFNAVDKTYDIRFFQEDGETQIGATQSLSYGATPIIPNYSRSNSDQYTYSLIWVEKSSKEASEDEDDWIKSVSAVTEATDYVAYFEATTNRYTVTATSSIAAGCIISGAGTYDYGTGIELTVTPNPGYRFLYWDDDNTNTDNPRSFTLESNVSLTAVVEQYVQDLDLSDGTPVTYSKPGTQIHNLILNASSNLNGAENLVLSEVNAVQGQAYFDLTIGDTESRHWHAFSVPFRVNLKKSGTPLQINGEELTLGRGYDIVYFDTETRATEGKTPNCWKYVEDGDSTLYPGKGYMIASGSRAINTIRFTAELDGEHKLILDNGISVKGGEGVNGGWNGIGNPKTYHSLLDAGVTKCQVHNGEAINSDGYTLYDMTGKLILGEAVFVQAPNDKSVVINRATTQSAIQPSSAPRRAQSRALNIGGESYDVHIAPAEGTSADHLYLQLDEDKEDKYVILADLAKAGISAVRPQMWVNRYGAKLCMNTIAPDEDHADFPIGIYAPKAGEYEIYVATQPEGDQALYLTLNDQAIWNLSENGAYTLYLDKGSVNNYGLRISAKTPAVATGVDEALVDANGTTRKVLIDNQVFIIREGSVYTVDGQLIK